MASAGHVVWGIFLFFIAFILLGLGITYIYNLVTINAFVPQFNALTFTSFFTAAAFIVGAAALFTYGGMQFRDETEEVLVL